MQGDFWYLLWGNVDCSLFLWGRESLKSSRGPLQTPRQIKRRKRSGKKTTKLELWVCFHFNGLSFFRGCSVWRKLEQRKVKSKKKTFHGFEGISSLWNKGMLHFQKSTQLWNDFLKMFLVLFLEAKEHKLESGSRIVT